MDITLDSILSRNGTSITATYDRSDIYVHNLLKASVEDLVKSFERAYEPNGRYEFVIEDGRIIIREKKAPDFGELSPSQELNDFVNTLIQGE